MKKLLLAAALSCAPMLAFAQTYPSPTFNSVTLQTPLASSGGGTGVNNGTNTVTLGGNLATSGAFPLTLTTTGATTVTLPTSGTLLNSTTGATAGANSNITSLTGLTTALPLSEGGTGATTASGALTALGAAPKVSPAFTTSLGATTSTQTTTVAPLTPIFEFNYPISTDPNHYADFAIQQTNAGNHTTYDNSAFSVSSAVVGNGNNAPADYDNGVNISVIKQNWDTSTVQGGINGLNIVVRQGTDDTDGITENIGVVNGYGAGIEGVTESFAGSGSQTVLQQVDYQLGEIETGATGGANADGLNLNANVGTLNTGLLIQSNAGAGWTNAISVSGNGAGGTTFSVTPAGLVSAQVVNIGTSQTTGVAMTISQVDNTLIGAQITMTGSGTTTPNKSIRVNGGALQIINSAGTAPIVSIDDNGDMLLKGSLQYNTLTTGTAASYACFTSGGVLISSPSAC
jgi:hypothetical protein